MAAPVNEPGPAAAVDGAPKGPVPSAPERPAARVTVVTRAACHLCADAEVAVATLAAELGFGWDTVDVDADPAVQDRYGDRVPVILVDGREHGYWRVEPDRLRRALAG